MPPLFSIKFAVYLYLDGKDINGEDIREKLLCQSDKREELRLFKLLYGSLTNDDFEIPDDEDDRKLVEDFLETLPPIQLVSAEDIMDALNQTDEKHSEMFREQETMQESADEKENDDFDAFGSIQNFN